MERSCQFEQITRALGCPGLNCLQRLLSHANFFLLIAPETDSSLRAFFEALRNGFHVTSYSFICIL